MEPSEPAHKRKTGTWLAITGVGQAWRFFISLLSAVVLGRLLLPADFGLLATLAPIIAVVELIRDLGFSQAIVQRKEITASQANGLFWISMAVSGMLSAVLVLTSHVIAGIFHEPRLVNLLIAQAVSILLSTGAAQAFAFLNRQLRFDLIALIDCVGATVGLVVSAIGAYLTHSYWSIFMGGVTQTALGLFLGAMLSGWRPGRPTLDRHVFDMAKFGAGVSFANFCAFLSRNSDNLLIARTYGPTSLGLYDRSYKLMLLPLTQVTYPVSRVLVPVLSRMQDDGTSYRRTYFTAITGLMAATQPGVIFAAIFSVPLIARLLGPHWSGVPPIFSWLALAGVHQLVTGSFGWLFVSQGRARELAALGLFTSVTTVAAFLVGLPAGPVGVAAAYAITDYVLRVPASWWAVGRTGPVRSSDLFRCIGPHVIASLASAGAAWLVHAVTPGDPLWALAAGGAGAYLVYGGVLLLFPSKVEMAKALLRRAPDGLLARSGLARFV